MSTVMCDSSFAHRRYTIRISTRCCASDTKAHFTQCQTGCRFGRSPLLLLLQRSYVSQRGADLFLNWLYVCFTCPIQNTRCGDSPHTFSVTAAATFRSLQPWGLSQRSPLIPSTRSNASLSLVSRTCCAVISHLHHLL